MHKQVNWRMALVACTELSGVIRVTGLQKVLEISQSNASRLLNLLHQWGYLKYADVQKRGYGGYELTAAGEKLRATWETTGMELTNAPGLHQRCKQCTLEKWRERSDCDEERRDS